MIQDYKVPKFKQFVIALGSPRTNVLREASDTAIIVPTSGSAFTYRELQSTVIAKPLFVPLMLTSRIDGTLVVLFGFQP